MISESMAYDKRHAKDTWQCQLCEDILHTWHTTYSWSENMFVYVWCECSHGRCVWHNLKGSQEKLLLDISLALSKLQEVYFDDKKPVISWSRIWIFDEVDIRCWLLVLIWLETTDGLRTNIRCQWEKNHGKSFRSILNIYPKVFDRLFVSCSKIRFSANYRWSRYPRISQQKDIISPYEFVLV